METTTQMLEIPISGVDETISSVYPIQLNGRISREEFAEMVTYANNHIIKPLIDNQRTQMNAATNRAMICPCCLICGPNSATNMVSLFLLL